jgi:hypothetical protein
VNPSRSRLAAVYSLVCVGAVQTAALSLRADPWLTTAPELPFLGEVSTVADAVLLQLDFRIVIWVAFGLAPVVFVLVTVSRKLNPARHPRLKWIFTRFFGGYVMDFFAVPVMTALFSAVACTYDRSAAEALHHALGC